jgi:hypothetical protein
MNKLLIFPLAFMFILTLFSAIYSSETYTGYSAEYSPDEIIMINNDTGEVNIPSAQPQSFDMWETTGAMVIIVAAIAVGIVAGITVLGSGISERAQSLIYNGILFLGLWSCLTIISSRFFLGSLIPTMFWISLTVIYLIGFGLHTSNADSSGG